MNPALASKRAPLTPPTNACLARLQAASPALARATETSRAKVGEIVFTSLNAAPWVFFPVAGAVSLQFGTADGDTLDLLMLGCESMFGQVPMVLETTVPSIAIARSDVELRRIRTAVLAAEAERTVAVRKLVFDQLAASSGRLAQAAHCHHAHTVLQRICGWLLSVTGYSHSPIVSVRHEELSGAVGAARPVVSRVLGELQRAEAIWLSPRRIMVHNRARIEATACQCFDWPRMP
jgi:CRP-like cAMP-binding protein